jgi:hypothetical protein
MMPRNPSSTFTIYSTCDFSAARGQLLEQGGRPDGVRVRVATELHHGLAVSDHSTEVIDDVDPLERARDRVRVSEIANDELCLLGQMASRAVGVRLRIEIVEDAHGIAASEERVHQVRTDESRAAGHQGALSSFAS